MDRKLMRENLLGMMVLVILIFIEVQATDHTSTSFHLSSVPIPFSHLSKLDFANLDLRNCIDKQHELCVKKSGIEYGNCLTRGFRICLELPKSQLDPEYDDTIKSLHFGRREVIEKDGNHFGVCLLGCHKRNAKKHS